MVRDEQRGCYDEVADAEVSRCGLSFFLSEALGSLRRNWVMTMAAMLTVFITMAILGVAWSPTQPQPGRHQPQEPHHDQGLHQRRRHARAGDGAAAEDRQHAAGQEGVYISKDQALEAFRKMMGSQADEHRRATCRTTRCRPTTRSTSRTPTRSTSVAQQFFDNPAVDNAIAGLSRTTASCTPRRRCAACWAPSTSSRRACGSPRASSPRPPSCSSAPPCGCRIFARRREIEIMRLVGATNWFIRWPFVLEGFITGLVGSVLAGLGIYAFNWTVFNWIKSTEINYLAVKIYPHVVPERRTGRSGCCPHWRSSAPCWAPGRWLSPCGATSRCSSAKARRYRKSAGCRRTSMNAMKMTRTFALLIAAGFVLAGVAAVAGRRAHDAGRPGPVARERRARSPPRRPRSPPPSSRRAR